MRLAYVCADPGVPIFGQKGCSIHVQEVVRAFQKQGIQVELFASRIDSPAPADLATLPLHSLPTLSKGDPAARERRALAANVDLRLALEHHGPFDLVYERYSLWSYAGMEYARSLGVPGLLEVNAPLIEEQAQYRTLVDRRGAEQVAARAFNCSSAVFTVSEEIAAYVQRHLIAKTDVYVVPNGVNADRFPITLTLGC